MRITLVTAGSRGDVQPYLALGLGLQRAGHAVTLAASENFQGLAREHGLPFHPLPGDFRALLESDTGRRVLETRSFLFGLRHVRRLLAPHLAQMARDIGAACREAEVIVSHVALTLFTQSVAEKTGAGFFDSAVQPVALTRAFPNPLIGFTFSLGGTYNWWSTRLLQMAGWLAFRSVVNPWRAADLGLPPQSFGPLAEWAAARPSLFGYSERVMPRPPDWPASIHVTGYWTMDLGAGWEPPPALVRFLEAGPPPVAIGFGSMSHREPAQTADAVLRALALTGQRGVLIAGWGGFGNQALPAGVLGIDSAPHDWLYPRMRAVVHHGGSGTTAAALRAGVPSIVVPFTADQPFWGSRVAALGVGPPPIPRRRLTAETLAAAIERVGSDEAMRARAAELGRQLRAEDGVARAAEVVERGSLTQRREDAGGAKEKKE